MLSIKAITDSGSAASYYQAADYYVKSIPTTLLFTDDHEIARQIGFGGKKIF